MRHISIVMFLTSIIWSSGINLPVSFSADFVQKVTDEAKHTIKYSGQILMNAPDIIKWIYQKPSQKEVCSSKGRVTVVDKELEQVSFYKLDKRFDLAKLLSNAKHYKDNLYTARYNGKYYTIALDENKQIEQIAYKDDMDNIVNIHFYKIKYSNKKIPADKLKCPFPNSYDIVEG